MSSTQPPDDDVLGHQNGAAPFPDAPRQDDQHPDPLPIPDDLADADPDDDPEGDPDDDDKGEDGERE